MGVVEDAPACIGEMRSQRWASFKWVVMKMVTPSDLDRSAISAPKWSRGRPDRRPRGSSRINASSAGAACHRELQALADTERQGVGLDVHHRGEVEAARELAMRDSASSAGRWKRRACRVLAHREFAGEREGLRHVAHTAARLLDVAGVRLRPSSSASPRSVRNRPVSIFMVVDLPQPLEPRKPKISPRRTCEFTSSTATEVAKTHLQAARLDDHRAGLDRRDLQPAMFAPARFGSRAMKASSRVSAPPAARRLGRRAGGEHDGRRPPPPASQASASSM